MSVNGPTHFPDFTGKPLFYNCPQLRQLWIKQGRKPIDTIAQMDIAFGGVFSGM